MSCLVNTNSIHLNIEGDGSISADAQVSPDAENVVEVRDSGVFVGAADVTIPPGMTLPFAGRASAIPDGWLLCDGRTVSRSSYSGLFAAVGTTYGPGDGSSTFHLPDTFARILTGYGSAGHSDVHSVGASEGSTVRNLRRPRHRHAVADPGHGHLINPAVVTSLGGGDSNLGGSPGVAIATATASKVTGITVGADVANDPLDAPSYIVLPILIKT